VHLVIAIFGDVVAWTIPLDQVARIRAAFPDLTITDARTDPALKAALADAEAAFSWRIGPEVWPYARRLRWVHTPAAGLGSMLTDPLKASDVIVTNSRGVHAIPIAEHVIGVTIALSRRMQTALRRQVTHTWAQNELADPPPRLLRGQTMGIVGVGAVGTEVARLASTMGMRVIAVRRRPDRPPPAAIAIEAVWSVDRLPELLAASDVVVLAAPLTDRTRFLVGEDEIRRMRPHALLVNVGRGKLVNEAALIDALRECRIGGAALDVVAEEPLDPASPLWDLPTVLLTPHTSGTRPDYWTVVTDLFIDNLRRFLRGEALRNVVDKDEGY
jgi:phosphoglycerate dehydrogenase-like enzyme